MFKSTCTSVGQQDGGLYYVIFGAIVGNAVADELYGSSEGRRWYIHAASDAEYERAVISRQTREQMAVAKRRGKKIGHPRKLSKKQISWARKALKAGNGKTRVQIAQELKVSPRTLTRALSGI